MTVPTSGMGLFTPALIKLEKNPLAQTIVKDIFGFNVPKILATRTPEERMDVATLELSNTAITLGASLTLPFLVRYPVHWLSKVKLSELSGEVVQQAAPQVKLARLGAALGFLFPFASAFWSAAFFRNYITAKRTNTANFEKIIGLENGGYEKTPEDSLQEELDYQLGMTKKVLLTGMGLGLASLFGFSIAAREMAKKVAEKGVKSLSKRMEWFFEHFQLEGKNANQVNHGLATFVFWLAPAYLGWLHAARGDNEWKEQALKAANATLWFSLFTPFGLNPLLKKYFRKWVVPTRQNESRIPLYKELLTDSRYKRVRAQLLKLKDKQFGAGLLVTILMLGLTPQLLNIYLTKRRHERDMAAQKENALRFRAEAPQGGLVIRPDSPFQVFM